ncbi:MAG: hypothetical protein ACI865_002913 [Flavobacteriaceae bacterium]|jgi:hypothetical protein
MQFKFLVCGTFCLLLFNSHSQRDIAEWQSSHPDVLFIQSDDFNGLSQESLDILKTDYIVYDAEITFEDIRMYENENSNRHDELNPEKYHEANRIKVWLGMHIGVKVITNSYYAALSIKHKTKFEGPDFILLEGDIITLRDIENYENIH